MPTATITLIGKAPTPAQKQALFTRTTDLMVEILGRTRDAVCVSATLQRAGDWAVGGVPVASEEGTGAHVVFRLLEGTNTPEQFSRMIAAMQAALEDVLGPSLLPAYVIFEQIPGYAWGVHGKSVAEMLAAKAPRGRDL